MSSRGLVPGDALREVTAFRTAAEDLVSRVARNPLQLFERPQSRVRIASALRATADPMLLLRRMMLYVPMQTEAIDGEWVEGQILREAEKSPACDAKFGSGVGELAAAELVIVDEEEAVAIHRSRHYLGSPRGAGLHFGLRAASGDRGLLSLVTISFFDLPHLAPLLLEPPGAAAVLSRMYVFPGAPRNTGTRTLGQLARWLRRELPEIRLLVTYINPNLGFSGSVYRSANWRLLGWERKRRYLYLGGRYLTDREAIHAYGTADYQELVKSLGYRVERSRRALQPLDVFGYHLYRDLRNQVLTPVTVDPPAQRVGL